jgi:hypothetical protein
VSEEAEENGEWREVEEASGVVIVPGNVHLLERSPRYLVREINAHVAADLSAVGLHYAKSFSSQSFYC